MSVHLLPGGRWCKAADLEMTAVSSKIKSSSHGSLDFLTAAGAPLPRDQRKYDDNGHCLADDEMIRQGRTIIRVSGLLDMSAYYRSVAQRVAKVRRATPSPLDVDCGGPMPNTVNGDLGEANKAESPHFQRWNRADAAKLVSNGYGAESASGFFSRIFCSCTRKFLIYSF